MGLPAAKIGDKAGGVILNSRANAVNINGLPPATLGSSVSPHGDSPHSSARITTGSSSVYSGGIPLSRLTDSATCSHSITTGSGDVNIG
jgi:uncharacterized Zn-binding protein involved in type VI secretion